MTGLFAALVLAIVAVAQGVLAQSDDLTPQSRATFIKSANRLSGGALIVGVFSALVEIFL